MNWTKPKIAAVMNKQGIAYTRQDLNATLKYLKGDRTCSEYDALTAWEKMMVDECSKAEQPAKNLVGKTARFCNLAHYPSLTGQVVTIVADYGNTNGAYRFAILLPDNTRMSAAESELMVLASV